MIYIEEDFVIKNREELLELFPERIRKLTFFGIPKNGMILLEKINRELNLNLNITQDENLADVVFDDICDSGKTLSKFSGKKKIILFNKNRKNLGIGFIYKEVESNEWIKFWFEKEDERVDLLQRFIQTLGEENREGLTDTAKRSAKAWDFLVSGNTEKLEISTFENESNRINQIVGLNGIEFYSTCEHHLLPFFGEASIFYIPDKKIIGISKLARILNLFSRRLQNQERITKQIADMLEKELKPKAIAVVLNGVHLCMKARGVQNQGSEMKTSELRGLFMSNKETREELFNLIK